MNKKITKIIALGALSTTLFVSGCKISFGNEDEQTWYTGEVSPTDSQGDNGDLYFDTKAGKLYIKKDGKWVDEYDVGKKSIQKIELIEADVETDTYKVTYTNGEEEIINSPKVMGEGSYSQEQIFEKYLEAYNNTIALDQYTLVTSSPDMTMAYDHGDVYSKMGDGYQTSTVKYNNSNNYVVYAKSPSGELSAAILDTQEVQTIQNYISSVALSNQSSVSEIQQFIKNQISNRLSIETNSVEVKTETQAENGKFSIRISGTGVSDTGSMSYEMVVIFGTHIERVKSTFDGRDGSIGWSGVQTLYIDDKLDASMKVTDFSEYPDPIINMFTNLRDTSIAKAANGYKVTRTVDGLDMIGYIETGDYTQHHRYYFNGKEWHDIYTGTWKEYYKDEEGETSVSDLENTSDELMQFVTLSPFEDAGEYIEKIEYSQVDGELVIEITVKMTVEDESENKKYLATYVLTYETNGNMSYFDKFTGIQSMVVVDENGELVEDDLTSERSIIEVFEYSMDEDLIEDFDPSDYINND